MQIKDIKTIEGAEKLDEIISTVEGHLLLLYNIVNNKFVLFNIKQVISYGYHGDRVYKGITEDNAIFNIDKGVYGKITNSKAPTTHFIYFPLDILNTTDRKFLETTKQAILNKARRTRSKREILGI